MSVTGKWYRGHGGWIDVGKWSIALLFKKEERDFKLLSERYGTTRSWVFGPFRIRHRGHIVYGEPK